MNCTALQEDNGMPVHLKGGTADALLYRSTMVLTIIGEHSYKDLSHSSTFMSFSVSPKVTRGKLDSFAVEHWWDVPHLKSGWLWSGVSPQVQVTSCMSWWKRRFLRRSDDLASVYPWPMIPLHPLLPLLLGCPVHGSIFHSYYLWWHGDDK